MQQQHLNAIYAALDEERYEDAARLSSQPEANNSPLVRALLAFCLAQLDRPEEALEIATGVLELPSTAADANLLSTLTHAFRAVHDGERTIDCYEKLLLLHSTSEAHAQQLFFALARAGQVKKMQKTAQLLYKGLGKRNYLCWAVTCMLTAEPGADKASMVLVLAEKMLRKLFFEVFATTRPGFEEVRLCVQVVAQQGAARAGDALALLDALHARPPAALPADQAALRNEDAGVGFTALSHHELRSELLRALGDGPGERAELLQVLALYPDQWTAHERLVDLACADGPSSDAETLLLFLRDCQRAHPSLRGPRLAELCLAERLLSGGGGELAGRLWGDGADGGAILLRLVCEYATSFLSRPCLFSDLKPHIAPLLQVAAAPFLEWLEVRLSEALRSAAEAAEGALADLLCGAAKLLQLRVLCACLLSQPIASCPLLATAPVQLLLLHSATAARGAPSIGGETAVKPGDELIQIVTTLLRLRAHQNPALETRPGPALDVWLRAYVGAYGADASSFAFAPKLDLMEAMRALGAGDAALQLFHFLKTRHVQHDSLSYLVLPTLEETGMFDEARRLHRQVLGFHASALRDSMDMVSRAYQSGSYAAVFEMHAFAARCARSSQLLLSRVELALLELSAGRNSAPAAAHDYLRRLAAGGLAESDARIFAEDDSGEALSGELRDNMDYGLLIRCDCSAEQLAQEEASRRRSYLHRIESGRAMLRFARSYFEGDWAACRPLLARLAELEAHSPAAGPAVWDMELSRGSERGAAALRETLLAVLAACVGGGERAAGTVEAAEVAVYAAQEVLIGPSPPAPRLVAVSGSHLPDTMLDPEWIREMSATARLLAGWVFAVLRHAAAADPALAGLLAALRALLVSAVAALSAGEVLCQDDTVLSALTSADESLRGLLADSSKNVSRSTQQSHRTSCAQLRRTMSNALL